MILHSVSFTLIHEAGSAAEQVFLADAERILSDIPGVGSFRVWRQVSPQSDLAWCFSMRFEDAAAYEAYNEHPDHRAFVSERWVPEVAAFQELDVEPYVPDADAVAGGGSR